jgi:hypothetical protein
MFHVIGKMCSKGVNVGEYTYGWWIGGQRMDPDTNSTFVWKLDPASLGRKTRPLTYEAWVPGQPNYERYLSKACLEIVVLLDYQWNDATCDRTLCYICEIDN